MKTKKYMQNFMMCQYKEVNIHAQEENIVTVVQVQELHKLTIRFKPRHFSVGFTFLPLILNVVLNRRL